MATGHNTWILDGRIAFEPELRTTPQGIPVCTLRLCWSEKYGGRESSVYVDAVCWRSLAQTAARYLHKGDLVGVEGKVVGTNRTHQDGSRRYELSINAEKLVFFPNGKSGERVEASEQSAAEANFAEIPDGADLPF